jgi:hypothetical protein
MAITSTLGGTSQANPVPYDPFQFLTFWTWEFTTGAGYFDFDLLKFVVTTQPATLVVRPREELQFSSLASNGFQVTGFVSNYYQTSYIRIFNEAETKWCKVAGDYVVGETIFTCSTSAYDFTDEWDKQHYSGDFYKGVLSITNSYIKTLVINYWDSGGQDYSNVQTNVTNTPLIFTEGTENVCCEIVFQFTSTGTKNFTELMNFNLIPATSFAFNYTNFILDTDDTANWGDVGDADQDNDTAPPLVEFPIGTAGETNFDANWDFNTNAYMTWGASWSYLYDPNDSLWAAKLKWPIAMNSRCILLTDRVFYGSFMLISADEERWFRFGSGVGYICKIEDSRGFHDDNIGSLDSNMQVTGIVDTDLNINVRMSAYGVTYEGTYDLKQIFSPGEPIYAALYTEPTASYSYWNDIFVYSYNAAPNTDVGQTAANGIFNHTEFLTLALNELADNAYYLYFKDKIRNSLDYSDLDSIYAMNPSYASDDFNALQPGEVCIVIDRYHRVYFYIVKSGSQVDSLPDFIRINDSLYWELMEVIQNEEMKVEQYPVTGLVSGSPQLITHTAHNRSKSYAPAVQLIHNNKVKTSGITVSVVSTTQLRLTTAETTAFTNLKINVYVTV